MAPSLFIGVYVALYHYQAQSDQELTVNEGDLLYLLETSQEDDWWKVKKRVPGLATEEPSGLVPNNYIEPAPVKGHARALYDYDRQTEEELTFKENTQFDIYDESDADWILVRANGSEYGFVPANYLEKGSGGAATSVPEPVAAPAGGGGGGGGAAFTAPPTTAVSNQNATANFDKPLPSSPPSTGYADTYEDEEEEAPPSLPARPGSGRRTSSGRDSVRDSGRDRARSASQSQFFSWAIQEVDGRKKFRATLAVGNGSIMYSPERASASPQQWDISDLLSYSSEKKHVFLEFQHPRASLDLHAGAKEVADEIVSALGEVAGANRAVGLREVMVAASSAGQKMGKVIYSFTAEGDDEVTVKEGDNVFIIDDKTSSEWWTVKTPSGQEGVMPSSFVDVSGDPASSSSRRSVSPTKRNSAGSGSGSRIYSSKTNGHHADHSESSSRNRQSGTSASAGASSSNTYKAKPESSKVRTWTDRSGSFKVDAALLGCADGKIHLHKLNGVKIAVAASKMSLEDLEYVESVTGVTLDDDKPLVDLRKGRSRRGRSNTGTGTNGGVPGGVSTGESGIRPASANSNTNLVNVGGPSPSKPEFDWFGFFLECGVDVNNCQRYSLNFTRDQMDESILEDVSPQVLRNLGLKEGDILRVTKKLDEKYSRSRQAQSESQGGLFTNADGNLKNNTSRTVESSSVAAQPKQDLAAATSSASQPVVASQLQSNHVQRPSTAGFEDDAWAVKSSSPAPPAQPPRPQAQQQTQQQAPVPVQAQQQQPQPTGALRDLADIKPLDPQKTAQSILAQQNLQKIQGQQQLQRQQSMPVAPLQQTLTGNAPLTLQLTGGATAIAAQQTGQLQPLGPFATGNAGQVYIVQQRTGGGMPLGAQRTGGSVVAAPLTNSLTGQSALQPLGPFATGNAQIISQPFISAQPVSGPFVTGGMFAAPMQTNYSTPNLTGLTNQFQQTSLTGASVPNVFTPAAVPQQQPLSNPFGNFGAMQATGSIGFPQATGFSQQPFQTFTQTNPMQQQQFGQQPFASSTFSSFPQQQPFQQPMTGFDQQGSLPPLQGQPTGFGFGDSSTGGANGVFPGTAAQALGSSFQQPIQQQFPPLQPQKTGPPPPVSFGGSTPAPLQPTATGRRANLAAATPSNPFGF